MPYWIHEKNATKIKIDPRHLGNTCFHLLSEILDYNDMPILVWLEKHVGEIKDHITYMDGGMIYGDNWIIDQNSKSVIVMFKDELPDILLTEFILLWGK